MSLAIPARATERNGHHGDPTTAPASASLDNVALRDPSSTGHKMSFAQLQQLTPHFDWTAYYRSASWKPLVGACGPRPVGHDAANFEPLLLSADERDCFPAGILQPPPFSVKNADAVNSGTTGVMIGHEISRGCDS
ncbi:hypothetical protein SBA3_3540014 [Candidatus Sulfopaludibacter sp. SbA3]|nr:hypothetical protein SBA3_3540014 [Candidatus Sulfopaludibacter sp. SbA3]